MTTHEQFPAWMESQWVGDQFHSGFKAMHEILHLYNQPHLTDKARQIYIEMLSMCLLGLHSLAVVTADPRTLRHPLLALLDGHITSNHEYGIAITSFDAAYKAAPPPPSNKRTLQDVRFVVNFAFGVQEQQS
jgi:hypothetical protein